MRDERARVLRPACVSVPRLFWVGVCVGWRMRIAWVERRMAVLFNSGWKLNRERGCKNTEAQTRIKRRMPPAWAIGAVPD